MTIPLFLIAATAGACLPVNSAQERITGADLARAGGAAVGFPAEKVFGYAPGPGAVKIFSTAALQRFAQQYGLPSAPNEEICFTRPAEPLTTDRVEAALRRAFGATARIELVDFLKTPAPEGELTFSGGGAATGDVGLFRGFVRYADRQRFAFWAKAKIEVPISRPAAGQDFRAGAALDPEQITWRTVWETPGPSEKPLVADDIAGAMARRAIRAGALIRRADIQPSEMVHRGDRVRVEAPLGNARVALEGLAESGGRQGEWIRVRNPNSNKVIRALIVDRGKAVVK